MTLTQEGRVRNSGLGAVRRRCAWTSPTARWLGRSTPPRRSATSSTRLPTWWPPVSPQLSSSTRCTSPRGASLVCSSPGRGLRSSPPAWPGSTRRRTRTASTSSAYPARSQRRSLCQYLLFCRATWGDDGSAWVCAGTHRRAGHADAQPGAVLDVGHHAAGSVLPPSVRPRRGGDGADVYPVPAARRSSSRWCCRWSSRSRSTRSGSPGSPAAWSSITHPDAQAEPVRRGPSYDHWTLPYCPCAGVWSRRPGVSNVCTGYWSASCTPPRSARTSESSATHSSDPADRPAAVGRAGAARSSAHSSAARSWWASCSPRSRTWARRNRRPPRLRSRRSAAPPAPPPAAAPTPLPVTLSALPLDFVANEGQWDAGTQFVASKGATAASFQGDGVDLAMGATSLRLNFDNASIGDGDRR